MKLVVGSASPIAAMAVLICACAGATRDVSTSPVANGLTNAQRRDSSVVDRLAMARCDREQACNHVGTGAKYATHDVCMDQMRGTLTHELNSDECPQGIDEAELNRCMAAIADEECGHPLDTLARLDRCRTGDLCMK